MSVSKFEQALARIDDFNRCDPHERELPYSERLTEWVLRLDPNASEALRIAARGQHIGRWTIPRDRQPMDRGGYLRWRETLKNFHAEEVGKILREVGYDDGFITRVRSLVLKRDLKTNPDTQTLEDALCLVFLETQFQELKDKTPDAKMKDIVRKTWSKMGEKGRAAALALPLSAEAKDFLREALA